MDMSNLLEEIERLENAVVAIENRLAQLTEQVNILQKTVDDLVLDSMEPET